MSLRTRLERIKGQRDAVSHSLTRARKELTGLYNEQDVLEAVCGLFRALLDQELQDGVKAVEQLQTEGLQAVFDDQDLSVEARVSESRGRVSVELLTKQKQRNGNIVEGLAKDDFGGSVLTVQSVILRVIIMLKRGLRPLLLLDESLPAFDPNYVVNMGRFLSALCKRLGVDILMVTHNAALFDAADHAYKIVPTKNGSVFEKVR